MRSRSNRRLYTPAHCVHTRIFLVSMESFTVRRFRTPSGRFFDACNNGRYNARFFSNWEELEEKRL